jgi:hypothetical protein
MIKCPSKMLLILKYRRHKADPTGVFCKNRAPQALVFFIVRN